MAVFQYCTPEWLEQIQRTYDSNPSLQESLKTLTIKLCYRVKGDPDWGIDEDIIFGSFFEAGKLTKLAFFKEEDARKEADFILSTTPQEWKKLLRKRSKFVTDFMLGKIKLEMGSRVGILGIAPHANKIVNAITQFEVQFPDEMLPEEIANYRFHMQEFRSRLGV